MTKQLILSSKSFLAGIAFASEYDRNRYIIDFIDTSSLWLRNAKIYVYRVLESTEPLEGKLLLETIKEFSVVQAGSKCCFFLDTGTFIQANSEQEKNIIASIADYVGVVYKNH